MNHKAYIVHHIPGRMRLKLEGGRGNPELLQEITESISPLPGVRQVKASSLTGSVLVDYAADATDFARSFAEQAKAQKLFSVEAVAHSEESGVAWSLDDLFKGLNDEIRKGSNGWVDLKEIMPFGVGTYAFVFVDRQLGAPLWLSLLMFAFSSYLALHETDPSDPLVESVEGLRAEIAALRDELRARKS